MTPGTDVGRFVKELDPMKQRWYSAQELRETRGAAIEALHPLGDGIRWKWPCGCVAVTYTAYGEADRVWCDESRCSW